MTTSESTAHHPRSLETDVYHVTVDGGRDAFFALSIECADSDDAWLMSDTVRSLETMR